MNWDCGLINPGAERREAGRGGMTSAASVHQSAPQPGPLDTPAGDVPEAWAPHLFGGKGNPKSVLSPSHESFPMAFSALTSTSTARQ